MSVSVYGNANMSDYFANVTVLSWVAQNQSSVDILPIDLSVKGNRLYQSADGSLRVIPKPLGEIVGERLVKPLIDCVYGWSNRSIKVIKGGLSFLDSAFSKILNFPPGVEAVFSTTDESAYTKCAGKAIDAAADTITNALKTNDPKLIQAAEKMFVPVLEQCGFDQSYNRARNQHLENQKRHNEEVQNLEKSLKECEKQYGTNYCYPWNKIDGTPQLFTTVRVKRIGDQDVQSLEWTTSPGYLSWTIYVNRWGKDTFFSTGSYNFDSSYGKPSVSTREQISKKDEL